MKKKKEFSKILLIQESILLWITTLAILVLAFIAILTSAFSELPWLTALVGLPWAAYGISQAFYYKKAQAENLLKIKNSSFEEYQEEYNKIFNENSEITEEIMDE